MGSSWMVALYLLVASAITAQQTLGKARSNNFAIFRSSFWHLVRDQDLYAWYRAEHWDLFKYSPTCALLFAPFAVLPYGFGLLCWNLLNAAVLSIAVVMLLPGRAGVAALLIVLLEAVGALQNTQSNALVAGLIILSVVAIERDCVGGGAAAVITGAAIKLFPLSAGLFGLMTPMRWRHVAWCAGLGVLFVALPLLVTSPATLAQQYQSWGTLSSQDATKVGMAWLGGVIELALGRPIPHAPVQLFGIVVLLGSAYLARDRWIDAIVRRLLLSSMLMFSVVFNHMAESPTFVIAYAGIGIWWAATPRARWRDLLVLTIVLLGSVGGSDLVPRDIRLQWHGRIQLKAIVTLVGWFALQADLWRYLRAPQAHAVATRSPNAE
ncbi:glycosyltransferase family 87 protein [Gemmatimonas sp.]|uniref:glycosyltransferase family 87 protein n=1 Tax=Gemmatimonas sp. TaxID=1962908 RepID=UPI003983A094